MDIATANEPLNPLAPMSTQGASRSGRAVCDALIRFSSWTDGIQACPSITPTYDPGYMTRKLTPQAHRVPDPGSRYGFHLPSPAPESMVSHSPTVPPMSRSASTAPLSNSASHQGSALPLSRSGSVALMSQSGVSWGGTPVTHVVALSIPLFRQGTPASQGNSIGPTSQNRPARGGTPVMDPITSVPLRSSQIAQQAQNSQSHQLSRTLSIHDINALPVPQQSVPPPPPYEFRKDEDGDTEPESDGFFQRASRTESEIDKFSPDKDDRAAKAALHPPGKYLLSLVFLLI